MNRTNKKWTAISQQEVQISFKVITLLNKENSRIWNLASLRGSRLGIICPIFPIPALIKKIFRIKNLVFDVYALLTKNLNPFSLDQKLSNQNKHEMIGMLWKECIPAEFYGFVCRKEYFSYLNGKNVLYPKTVEIVWRFIAGNNQNYNRLRNNLCQFKEIFQYIYLMVYP